MSSEEVKLTKKQIKALEFKAKKSEKAAKELETVNLQKEEKTKAIEDAKPKKRKTRRGRKGKPRQDGAGGPRLILFVGNLPYGITESDLKLHFKASKPDLIRHRIEKGFAFLEFNHDGDDIQARIDSALKLHHSLLNNRKINVELTAGGGGNSNDRLTKIKEKNEKLMEERKARILKEEDKLRDKRLKEAQLPTEGGVHPSRLNLIEK
ncbi:hypothetical protein CANARDRAFT_194985 [[Candida] arabinofermentans NRRL YB-2248]|uniref:RRM domain-containing protein n=1 Tax=[Candida] arabinofermentans NRRL YB-2248 TaxID=983967 RepID=A0A1E4T5S5_9ASCO|nr:hypothetical protein CANARDRAFT_194985 [[Candida] arabinofermentans NRRL YB-2248]